MKASRDDRSEEAAAEITMPYLSIVLVGRNDDFGGDFNGRMFAAAEFNHRNMKAYGIPHEYVFVEWNPIPDKPYLAQLLGEEFPWWHRRYVVDPLWHTMLSTNARLAFMEFFAKNVGIRRAKGEFILATNTDVWLSRQILSSLARMQLDKGVLYRCIRVDLRREVGYQEMSFAVLEHPESFLRSNMVAPPYFSNGAGDFLLLDRESYLSLRGFNELVRYAKIHKDANFCDHSLRHGLRIELMGQVDHLDHESSWNNVMYKYGLDHREAPFGPNWDWQMEYKNSPDWGLGGAKEVPREDGIIYVSCDGDLQASKGQDLLEDKRAGFGASATE